MVHRLTTPPLMEDGLGDVNQLTLMDLMWRHLKNCVNVNKSHLQDWWNAEPRHECRDSRKDLKFS